jgi:SAM-dependent methyltransferase
MWDEGYVSEIEYTHGYYSDLAPNRIKFTSLLHGIRHAVSEQPKYLELGFGQGLSLNIHAATNPGQYWGADFNPAQAANAQALAQHGAGNLRALDDSFEQFLERKDLPEFDIITLHGIWSWVSDAARQSITEIAKRHLKPGGLLCISYNARAGWASGWPLRDILVEHYQRNPSGSVPQRVSAALEFASELDEAGARYFAQNPVARERLEHMKTQDPRYLAHEFFNKNWQPMTFTDVCSALANAKLEFAGSAHLMDFVDAIHITEKGGRVLKSLSDKHMQGTVRDLLVSQQFRKDIFVKGSRSYTPLERHRLLLKTRFILVRNPDSLPETVQGALGRASLDQDLYSKILRAFEHDGSSAKNLEEVMRAPECADLRFAQIEQAVVILLNIGYIELVNTAFATETAMVGSQRLNAHLCQRAEIHDEGRFLASSVTGSGVAVSRFEQLFLNALSLGVEDVAAYVWRILEQQGQRLKVKDKTLETKDENVSELRRQFVGFENERLPYLRRLGIVSERDAAASSILG